MTTLRGKKPTDRSQRLKLLLSGSAGVGKTKAAIKLPRPYIIDTESGSVHYGEEIDASGGAVFETRSAEDIVSEVRSLITEPNPFLTLVIDPITTVYDIAIDEAEERVGTDYGKHIVAASKVFKRLCNLLTIVDMNVIITAHSKTEYGVMKGRDGKTVTDSKGEPKRVVVGETFDGYKKLDYIFDLWMTLERADDGTRWAKVRKTRLPEFPDQSRFEWTYDAIAERFGRERLETGSKPLELAKNEQIERFRYLMHAIGDEAVKQLRIDAVLATVDDITDLTSDRITKGIEIMEKHREGTE